MPILGCVGQAYGIQFADDGPMFQLNVRISLNEVVAQIR